MEVASKEDFLKLESTVALLQKKIEQMEKLPPLPEWVTIEQAAEMLHRCRQTVTKLAKEGDLVYKQGKRKIEISTQSIKRYSLLHTVNA